MPNGDGADWTDDIASLLHDSEDQGEGGPNDKAPAQGEGERAPEARGPNEKAPAPRPPSRSSNEKAPAQGEGKRAPEARGPHERAPAPRPPSGSLSDSDKTVSLPGSPVQVPNSEEDSQVPELVRLKRVPLEMRRAGYWAARSVVEREQAKAREQVAWEQAEARRVRERELAEEYRRDRTRARLQACQKHEQVEVLKLRIPVSLTCLLQELERAEEHERDLERSISHLTTAEREQEEDSEEDLDPINKAEDPMETWRREQEEDSEEDLDPGLDNKRKQQGEDQKEEAQKKKPQKTAVSGRQRNCLPEDSSSD